MFVCLFSTPGVCLPNFNVGLFRVRQVGVPPVVSDAFVCLFSTPGVCLLYFNVGLFHVRQVGSNPLDADCAMMMLKAMEENDSCAIKHLDLMVSNPTRSDQFKMVSTCFIKPISAPFCFRFRPNFALGQWLYVERSVLKSKTVFLFVVAARVYINQLTEFAASTVTNGKQTNETKKNERKKKQSAERRRNVVDPIKPNS